MSEISEPGISVPDHLREEDFQRLYRSRHPASANRPRVTTTTRRRRPTPRSKLHLASQRRADLAGIPSLISSELNRLADTKIIGDFNMKIVSYKPVFAIRPTPSLPIPVSRRRFTADPHNHLSLLGCKGRGIFGLIIDLCDPIPHPSVRLVQVAKCENIRNFEFGIGA